VLKLADLMVKISGGKIHNEHVSTHERFCSGSHIDQSFDN